MLSYRSTAMWGGSFPSGTCQNCCIKSVTHPKIVCELECKDGNALIVIAACHWTTNVSWYNGHEAGSKQSCSWRPQFLCQQICWDGSQPTATEPQTLIHSLNSPLLQSQFHCSEFYLQTKHNSFIVTLHISTRLHEWQHTEFPLIKNPQPYELGG